MMKGTAAVNKDRLVAQGQEVYEEIKDQLEPDHHGEIVAIEVESGEYFLGDSVVAAAKKGRAKHPDKLFFFVKIGYPAVHIRR